ncbi:MAG TPA: endonuclease [Alphaproteobacteria bacterium]|nr:endonuclease [Alphaproteobacteria bacterium]HAJ45305.1 endonuclease [Alphaproteobacteria bacterium]
MFAVYILASKPNGTLYTGVTSDLLTRVRQHKAGTFDGFTKTYGVTRSVYREFHDYWESAFMREKRIKRWLRNWKIALIEADNPHWEDLAASWDHPEFRPDWGGITPPR